MSDDRVDEHVDERTCDCCSVFWRVDLLERVDVALLDVVCPFCAAALSDESEPMMEPAREWPRGNGMTTEHELLVRYATQIESMAAVHVELRDGGELTVERAKAALDLLRQQLDHAADALQAIELLEGGRALGVAV